MIRYTDDDNEESDDDDESDDDKYSIFYKRIIEL